MLSSERIFGLAALAKSASVDVRERLTHHFTEVCVTQGPQPVLLTVKPEIKKNKIKYNNFDINFGMCLQIFHILSFAVEIKIELELVKECDQYHPYHFANASQSTIKPGRNSKT